MVLSRASLFSLLLLGWTLACQSSTPGKPARTDAASNTGGKISGSGGATADAAASGDVGAGGNTSATGGVTGTGGTSGVDARPGSGMGGRATGGSATSAGNTGGRWRMTQVIVTR